MSTNASVSTIFSAENSWRSDALDLLASFAQLAAIHAIPHGAHSQNEKGVGGTCCRVVLYGVLIAAVVRSSSLPSSIWLWLYQAVRGETLVPQNSGMYSP